MGQIKNIKLHIVTDIKVVDNNIISTTTTTTTTMSDTKVPAVPETLLKRQKNIERVKSSRAIAIVKRRKALKEKRRVIYKKAQQYAKEYRAKERDEIRLRRMAKRDTTPVTTTAVHSSWTTTHSIKWLHRVSNSTKIIPMIISKTIMISTTMIVAIMVLASTESIITTTIGHV